MSLSSQNNVKLVSIVIPVLNESQNIRELYKRLKQTLEGINIKYQIVLVDDGSTDNTAEVIRDLAGKDPTILFVELTRNFGHQYALSAGLDYCDGSAAILMDADLQDTPEAIPQFLDKWQEGFQVVYAVRSTRKENFFKQLIYKAYYRMVSSLATIDLPLDAGDFCLLDRAAIDSMRSMPERSRYLRGLRSWIGFKQYALPINREGRFAGSPKYNLKKLVTLGMDGIISFSFIPLRAISVIGFLVSIFSILMVIFYFVKRLTVGLNPPGFATIVVLISFFAGIQMVTLGIIGEYIARIFAEVKNRPLYIVKEVVRNDGR